MERRTSQRSALLKAFQQAGRPLSPQEALELARPHAAGLGIATVYRALKSLVEEGQIEPVRLPGQPPRYEPAGKHHHHHFRCRSCNQVFEIPGCPGNLEPLVPKGFVMEGHEVVLYGRCKRCRRGRKRAIK